MKCKAEVDPVPHPPIFPAEHSDGRAGREPDEAPRPTLPLTGGQKSGHNNSQGAETFS